MAQKLSWRKTSWLPDKTNAEFDEVPREFWADLLHLIGTGNADQIDAFAQIAWPGTKPGGPRFVASYRKQLRKSPHMAEFQRLNAIYASKPALKQFVYPTSAVPKPILPVVSTITTPAPQIGPDAYGDPLARTLPFSGGPGTSGFGAEKDGGFPVTAYPAGGDVLMPQLVSKVEPEYSEEARDASLSGTVLLSIIVDEQGLPRDIRVIRPIGLGLDEKAVKAVSQWRFRPGLKGRRAVAVRANVEISFRMCCK
jgi:TonB family protein